MDTDLAMLAKVVEEAGNVASRSTPAGKLRTESVNNCEFSEQGYTAPGYLVTCGKVFTQSGRGTAKEL